MMGYPGVVGTLEGDSRIHREERAPDNVLTKRVSVAERMERRTSRYRVQSETEIEGKKNG
jgi:hypothetical protein